MNIKLHVFASIMGVAALGCATEAAIVQLPKTVVYSGRPAPRVLLAKIGDSNIRVVRGLDFRITSQPKANGISKGYLESQVRRVVTSYDPQTGLLTATTPKMAIGSISAEVTVEVPDAVNLDIRSSDGNVSLERISVESLTIETSDGNVDMLKVGSNGQGRIRTSDGNVDIQESSMGKISAVIKGDGRFKDERGNKPAGPGALSITTTDGNITVRE